MIIHQRFLAGILLFAPVATVGAEPRDSDIASMAKNLRSLYRVTAEPHLMIDSTVTFCRPPGDLPHNVHEGVIQTAYCNVYVNELAKPIMLTGRGTYPVGSLVVKSKLRSKDKPDIELLTVMRKMADHYDQEHGNWEYSVIGGPAKRVLARGKIDSCISCHVGYRATDFVSRTYLSSE